MSSCLTISPLPRTKREAVYFLWHFPWDHSRFPLETALPCGARTFLRGIRTVRSERDRAPTPRRPPCRLSLLQGLFYQRWPIPASGFSRAGRSARPVCPPTVRRRFTGRFRREILN